MASPDRPPRLVRLLAAGAVLCLAGTFVAAQIDFVRRHAYGISPTKYWLPQLTHIWLPGLGAALLLAAGAFALHRRGRAD
jgi:hypothetical protein